MAKTQDVRVLTMLLNEMNMTAGAACSVANEYHMAADQRAYAATFLESAIRDHIDEFRKTSFEKFRMRIDVCRASRAKPMKMQVAGLGLLEVGYHVYVFAPRHNQSPEHRVRVRIRKGSIQVYCYPMWQPLHVYLDRVDTYHTWPLRGAEALDEQMDWWHANGKSFDLEALPRAIRDRILGFVIGPSMQPFPADPRAPGAHVRRTDLAIARTSKALADEAKHALYNTTPFVLETRLLTERLLLTEVLRTSVKRLTLTMSLSDFFAFFRVEPGRGQFPFHRPYVAKGLREMSLTFLQVEIERPSPYSDKRWLEGVCHKGAIDLLMRAAWPSVRGHPVKLTGFIDMPQKAKLEARALAALRIFSRWQAHQLAAIGTTGNLTEWDRTMARQSRNSTVGVSMDGGESERTEKEVKEYDGKGLEAMTHGELFVTLRCECRKDCREAAGPRKSMDELDPITCLPVAPPPFPTW